jgi:hypothetical protein
MSAKDDCMSTVSQEQERVVRGNATISPALLAARIVSYTGIVVYLLWPGVQVNWAIIGIWFWGTYLLRFVPVVIGDRICGPSPPEERRLGVGAVAAIITVVVLIGEFAGLW